MKVVIATRNPDKAREMKALLRDHGIEGMALDDMDPGRTISQVDETGSSLMENAMIKARTIFSVTGMPTIADDTGLEVDALDGAPGVYSARYAGEGATYEENVNKLLTDLRDVPPGRRTARFRTVACFVDGQELCAEGVVQGVISREPRGESGFGYDPVFTLNELRKTYAELTEEEKNRFSHRGKAMRKLVSLMSEDLFPTQRPS
ncbi:MAG: RdgB/HAM1 family non-canonical purine NTP pyrophosphatase [Fidelibacterota bacterium]